MPEATRPAGFVYAQHRSGVVYRRADLRDHYHRSRSPESPVTFPESPRSPSPDRWSRYRNHRSRWTGILTPGKLVRVTQGEVFDVAVDLRRASPNFGKWAGVVLSADNHRQLWVPPGFAHGFVVTSDTAEFLYKTTDYWYPEHERSLLWNDPAVGVQWPIQGLPQLAAKDAVGRALGEAEVIS